MLTSWLYAILFLALALLWPLWLIGAHPDQRLPVVGMVLVPNAALVALVWYYNSDPGLSFFRGLDIICGSMMSGCANITLIYLIPTVTVVYLLCIFNAARGMIRGRQHSRERWRRLVIYFYDRRLHKT